MFLQSQTNSQLFSARATSSDEKVLACPLVIEQGRLQ